jgi:hypothetical protein
MNLPILWYRWIPRNRPADFRSTGLIGQLPGFFIERGVYRLYAGGRPMTAMEYLSPTKGVGGNITGFFEYEEHLPPHVLQGFPGKTTLAQTQIYFGQGRDLILIPTSELPKRIQYAAGFVQNNDTPIVACPGMVKVTKLGTLMARTEGGRQFYGQESEWNLILADNLEVPAYKISFGNFDQTGTFIPQEVSSLSTLQAIVQNAYDQHKNDIPTQLQNQVSAHTCQSAGKKTKRR